MKSMREDVSSDRIDKMVLGEMEIKHKLETNDDYTPEQARADVKELVREVYQDSGRTAEEIQEAADFKAKKFLGFRPSNNMGYKELQSNGGTHVSSKRDTKTRS